MSELKRNADFAMASAGAKPSQVAPGIDESQPWRTAEMQQALAGWNASAEAGFDPYNHVGTLARKAHAA